ncbi:Solute carrier family 25 member 46 [Caenorhabditis elegans]|uniref:Solute carrier family 25 member 46 n=1 Tax=Caenorhabditis elegans TaxID=6239 RepID=Q9U2J0_CAEEL|nr:Solute carrier family 25 member 46 [Caenorhabditis elegans]CAA21607.2 Solute carrier family 25 member 46 [Caenorhabditis elegans]|eukprot:NP_493364.1 SLC (SoLute Carrier) homolog [Caenorhabditis elegans]
MPTQFIRNRSAFPQGTNNDIDDFQYQNDFSSSSHQLPSTASGYSEHSSHQNFQNHSPPPGKATTDPLAGALLGLSDVITKSLISHPCGVLRRQCQVHQFAGSLHLTPVTLIPVICNSVAKQGIQTFWKGAIGSSVLWGLTNVTEIVLGDLMGLPRTFVVNGSAEKYWKHIVLKGVTFVTMTPFYISSFIETVRSESGIGGEDNKILDVLVKGVDRMRYFLTSGRDPSRRFSIIHLAIPTAGFQVGHYMLQTALYHQFFRMAKRYVNRKSPAEKTTYHDFLPQMFAQTSSMVLTDLILYPFETIVHRMYIQGTRTLIDNMDTGLSAVSMTVKYSGYFDCVRQVLETEGFWALYAGVGAVLLEYSLHQGLQQLVRACFDRGSELLRKATQGHPVVQSSQITPPISAKSSFNGPISNSFPSAGAALLSPMSTPRKHSTPPKDPTEFPTFGETVSQIGSPYQMPDRPNVFGSPPNRTRATHDSTQSLPPLQLNIRPSSGDPFSG